MLMEQEQDCEAGAALGAGYTPESKTGQVPALTEPILSWRRHINT